MEGRAYKYQENVKVVIKVLRESAIMTVCDAVIALPEISDLAEMNGIREEVPGVGEAIIA